MEGSCQFADRGEGLLFLYILKTACIHGSGRARNTVDVDGQTFNILIRRKATRSGLGSVMEIIVKDIVVNQTEMLLTERRHFKTVVPYIQETAIGRIYGIYQRILETVVHGIGDCIAPSGEVAHEFIPL